MKANYDDALSVLHTLTNSGHSAYLAGGCVRDGLLAISPSDFDVATSATPDEVIASFEHTVPVGASFGVVKVVIAGGRELDVATFRTDGVYSDNRHPDTVTLIRDAKEDVKRRDFTINALLEDADGKVIDYVNGQEDLKNKVLRTVGNPEERFTEDALRMMRAIRFAIRFNLNIEEATWAAIKKMSASIKNVSTERVTEELMKIFSYGNCDRAYLLLRTSKLWTSWFGTTTTEKDSWRGTIALNNVKAGDPFELTINLILFECRTDIRDFHLNKLSLTNQQKKAIFSLYNGIGPVQNYLAVTTASKRKIVQREDLSIILKFLDYVKDTGSYMYYIPNGTEVSQVLSHMKEMKDLGWPAPIVTGDSLIEMGFRTGPIFTEILELIRDEQLENRLTKLEEVKPFILARYPSIPRRMDDGTLVDDTVFRRVIAQCPKCGRSMSVNVSKDVKGNYLWSSAKGFINVGNWPTRQFYRCQNCYARKSKKSFVEGIL